MIRLASPRLSLVVELEPGTYATEPRESPACSAAEAPEQWTEYWAASLANAGLRGLTPISPGSWFVSTAHLGTSELAIVLVKELEQSGIPGFPDSDGEVEEDLEERIRGLDGGLALFDGEKPLVEPSCCGDLSNLEEWRNALDVGSSDWMDLWIGHPQLRFRVVRDDVEIQQTQEYDSPRNPQHFVVTARKLESALLDAQEEQKRFEGVVRSALDAISALRDYTGEKLELLSQLLVGRVQE